MDKVLTSKVIFSKNGIEVIRNIHRSGDFTYDATNSNEGMLRSYTQAPSLEAVREYMAC